MKKLAILLLSLVLLFSFVACRQQAAAPVAEATSEPPAPTATIEEVEEEIVQEPTEVVVEEEVTEEIEEETTGIIEESTDLFPDKVEIEYANGFTVEYFDTYKVITVLTPWDFATETFQYVLVQDGTEAPQGYDQATFVTIPLQTIAPLSTTFIPFLDLYGLMDSVVAVSDGVYVSNQTILDKVEDGLPQVGYGSGVDIETLLLLEPDVIMTNGYGFPDYDAHPALINAGMTVVINGDYMENTPLGRAEWGKFIAVFYNQEAIANQLFDETVASYDQWKAAVADVSNKPTVFLNTPFEGTWYVPGGNSYMANFVNDAGGEYLWADEPSAGTLYLGFEDVVAKAAEDGQIWLHPGGFNFTAEDLLNEDERYAEFTAFQTGALYNNNKALTAAGGNDFFESGIAHPDVILADLIAYFHPDIMVEIDPAYQTTYYQVLP
jgi:iron complex transport system substrate-binding protein